MSLVVLAEGERRSATDWQSHLSLQPAVWNGLLADGVFSAARRDRNRAVRLDFVGFIALEDKLLACVPRFGLNAADPVSWLRRVLSAYFARERRRSRGDAMIDLHHRDHSVFREIDALATLLNSFTERGLYRRTLAASTKRGSGTIDWTTSLARCDPLIVDGRPLYLDPYRREQRSATNEVSHLQAAVTAWLARKYGARVPSALSETIAGIDLDARMAPDRTRSDLSLLSRERSVTYLAPDLQLLDVLEAVVSGRREMSGVAGTRLHGTSAFALVWEDGLRDLFGDDSSEASLGVANWYDVENETWSDRREAPSRRLDLLLREKGELFVLDAKYHYPYPLVRPGWSDIIKQIYYGESIVRDAGTIIRNAFLLPMPGSRLNLAGRVRVEEAARAFPEVEAWTLDPEWVFSGYGDGDPTRRTRAREALLVARDEMGEMLGQA